ncbi:M15 family metallopeptidase [Dethiothermospora halolimnae]|uniref:M15 family metallopeptidase n=1 Tax=Dethiothermospora halolimnae TaxID=3114390 RepID=UPI003CCBDC40
MTKRIFFVIIIFLLLLTSCGENEFMGDIVHPNKEIDGYNVNMKRDILCLMMAYPEYIKDLVKKDDNIYLIMESGTKILYDDKREKSFSEKLNNPDLQDMLEQPYTIKNINTIPDKNFDPGRIRVDSFLKEVYGKSRKEIESNLTNLKVGYKYYPFNKKNSASKALKNAITEAAVLARNNYKIYSCLFPSSGTYNYRVIAGTNRLSPHSFGIAIDLRRNNKDYWKWASRDQGQKRLAEYPKGIVRIFEDNGFVWGGKWNHFDILHFEYRPELIIKARYFNNKSLSMEKWYKGVELTDKVKEYIRKIDSIL